MSAVATTDETLRWVERQLGAGWRVVARRRLVGGISSAMHRLAVEHPAHGRRQVVLRRWIDTNDYLGDPVAIVERESLTLTSLEGTGIPAPQLLASSTGDDSTGGVPVVLMTRVPGHVHLAPRDHRSWLGQMASTLAAVHDLQLTLPASPPRADSPRDVPTWTSRPSLLRAALDVGASEPPQYEPRFTHGDYQHFNLLWSRERLTGVVDWTFSAQGPADRDVAHCRRNLAILLSADWAEEFRLAYEAETGRTVHPWFDVRALTGFSEQWQHFIPLQVGGRIPVDVDGMPGRVEDLLARTMKRL